MNKIIILLCILIIGININLFVKDKLNCDDEYNILITQYIDYTNTTTGGNCKEGCLFMEVLKVQSGLYYSLNNYSRYENEFRTLYFAYENQTRKDLKNNNEIIITWCDTEHGKRIKEIK